MPWALLGSALSAAALAIWALIERMKRKDAQAQSMKWMSAYLKERDEAVKVYESARNELKRREKAIEYFKAEIVALERDVAKCLDPVLVRRRLNALFDSAETNATTTVRDLPSGTAPVAPKGDIR